MSESVFERVEMMAILAALGEAGVVRTKAGVRNVLRIPAIRQLAEDSRLLSIATRLVGAHPIPFRATLFDKSPTSNWLVTWHQDTALPVRGRVEDPEWGPWSMKGGVLHAIAPASALDRIVALRIHLDDSTEMNGPLRVLPGTHACGVLTRDQIRQMANVIAPVTCTASAGGVVAMRPLTVHASSKVTDNQPRRVLHIEYARDVSLSGGATLAIG